MKFIKGLFITLLVLFVLIIGGLFVFLKTFNINKYHDQIASEVSKQLGRNVTMGNLDLNFSLINGVYAEVLGLKVSEDPSFGQTDFASVGAVKLNVDIMAYASRREIVVSKVVVDALKLTIIRDSAGAMNIQKIGPPQTAAASAPATPAPANTGAPTQLPKFSVQSILVSNAAVLYVDKGQNPPMQIAISHIDLDVKNFSLNQPFSFTGEMAVLGEEKNLTLSGRASVNATTQEVKLNQAFAEFDLAKLKVADLLKAVPSLASAGLKEGLDGKVAFHVESLTAGTQGLQALTAKGSLENGKVATTMLPVPVERIMADFTADAKNIDVGSFSMQVMTGMVTGKAKITDYMTAQGLSVQTKAIAVPLAGLVAGVPSEMKLGGGLNAELTLSGQNLANTDQFLSSLNGSGQIDVQDGKIENFNFLKTLLSRIEFIPGLAATVEATIPEKYKEDYMSNETIFQTIRSSLTITNGAISMPDVIVLSDLFEANAQLTADAKLVGKVTCQVKIPADLSESLAASAPALGYLKGRDERIVIPLTTFDGSLTNFKPIPDLKFLMKNAAESEGRNQVNKFFDKVLKTDENAPAGQAAPSPEKDVINGVLDKIFQ